MASYIKPIGFVINSGTTGGPNVEEKHKETYSPC